MKRIYFMGDIHGSYTPIQALDRKEELTPEDSIVLLGDTGLNYYQSERDIELKEILTEVYGTNNKLGKLLKKVLLLRNN